MRTKGVVAFWPSDQSWASNLSVVGDVDVDGGILLIDS